jgi:hypothetical protein
MTDVQNSDDRANEDRRKFLATCGKFAVVTPPSITVLLSTSLTSDAIAASGARSDRGGSNRGGLFDDDGRHDRDFFDGSSENGGSRGGGGARGGGGESGAEGSHGGRAKGVSFEGPGSGGGGRGGADGGGSDDHKPRGPKLSSKGKS